MKQANPEYGVGDIAKELGRKWSDVDPEVKSRYEAMAEKDKARYEQVRRGGDGRGQRMERLIKCILIPGNDGVQGARLQTAGGGEQRGEWRWWRRNDGRRRRNGRR